MRCPNCNTILEKDPDGIHYVCPNCESRFKAKQKTQSKPTPPSMPQPQPKPKAKPKPKPKPEPEYDEDEFDDEEDFGDDDFGDDFDDEEDYAPAKKKKPSRPAKRIGLNMPVIILAIFCIALAAAAGFMFFKYQELKKNYDNLVQAQQSFNDLNSFDSAPETVDSFVADPLENEPDIATDQSYQDEIPSTPDVTYDLPEEETSDGSDDSLFVDEGTSDAGMDTGTDAGRDTGADADTGTGVDDGTDTGADASMDTGVDDGTNPGDMIAE